MNCVRVGLVGAGRMGKNHARVFSTLRHVELVGICDANATIGQTLAQKMGTHYMADMDELLDKVDAVSIVTPTPSHFDLVMHCLERKIDVFVEKPITTTVREAEILAEAAARSGCIVQVGHIERFNPAYAELKHVLEEMTVLAINFRRLSPYAGSNTDVDVVLDLMIHDLDLVLDLVGAEPVALDARGLTAFSGAIDHAYVTVQFDSGPLLSVTASRVTEQKVREIDVTALEAFVNSDLLNKTVSVHRSLVGEYLNHNHRGVKYRQESVVERIYVPIAEPLFLELQHFIECVQQRSVPLVTAEAGLQALRLATRIREAIQGQIAQPDMERPAAMSTFAERPPVSTSTTRESANAYTMNTL